MPVLSIRITDIEKQVLDEFLKRFDLDKSQFCRTAIFRVIKARLEKSGVSNG